jgi:hypothetical protein
MHALVLQAGGVVVEETFNICLEFEKHRVARNFRAEFPGLFDDG